MLPTFLVSTLKTHTGKATSFTTATVATTHIRKYNLWKSICCLVEIFP